MNKLIGIFTFLICLALTNGNIDAKGRLIVHFDTINLNYKRIGYIHGSFFRWFFIKSFAPMICAPYFLCPWSQVDVSKFNEEIKLSVYSIKCA